MVLQSKNWTLGEDRPREKMRTKGPSFLTDAELIAVLLGTGSKRENVLRVAQKMLDSTENSLSRLMMLPLDDLTNMPGVGYVKALRFKAALELIRRMQFDTVPKNFKLQTSKDAFRIFGPHLGDLNQEEFWMVMLNRRCKIIDKTRVSSGGLTSTIADPRIIFGQALGKKASSIVVAHNHPSGSLEPSQADINLTKKLKAAGEFLDIQLVDHLIISENNYFSFADSGLLT